MWSQIKNEEFYNDYFLFALDIQTIYPEIWYAWGLYFAEKLENN